MVDDVISDFKKFAKYNYKVSEEHVDNYFRNMTQAIIEERNTHFREVDVFSRLIMDRIIFLGTEINDTIANIIVAQLLYLTTIDTSRHISLYINSPGGSIYAGLAIYDTMQYVQPEIYTVGIGLCASMAAVLLASGAQGKRTALPHSRIMIHQPLGTAQGQASEIEITYKQIMNLRQELYGILAKHTGQNIEKIEQDSDRDHWLTAQEAKQYGIIDYIHNNPTKV